MPRASRARRRPLTKRSTSVFHSSLRRLRTERMRGLKRATRSVRVMSGARHVSHFRVERLADLHALGFETIAVVDVLEVAAVAAVVAASSPACSSARNRCLPARSRRSCSVVSTPSSVLRSRRAASGARRVAMKPMLLRRRMSRLSARPVKLVAGVSPRPRHRSECSSTPMLNGPTRPVSRAPPRSAPAARRSRPIRRLRRT